MTAPALRRLSITGLLVAAITSRWSLSPLVVAKPSWSILTLTVTGTPASGPDVFPARDRRIDGGGLRQHIVGPVVDHGVDLGIDRVEPGQRGGSRPPSPKPFST